MHSLVIVNLSPRKKVKIRTSTVSDILVSLSKQKTLFQGFRKNYDNLYFTINMVAQQNTMNKTNTF